MERMASFWDRNKDVLVRAAMALLVGYALLRNVVRASVRQLWYDELCTWILTTLPDFSSVWKALLRAADSMPPGYYRLESLMSKLIPNQQIAFRLPSILAAAFTI